MLKCASKWEKYRIQRNFVVHLIRKAKLVHEHKTNDLLSITQQCQQKNGGILLNHVLRL